MLYIRYNLFCQKVDFFPRFGLDWIGLSAVDSDVDLCESSSIIFTYLIRRTFTRIRLAFLYFRPEFIFGFSRNEDIPYSASSRTYVCTFEYIR